MIMKKYFRALGLMVAAAFTLTNCAEQIDAPVESAKVPFEIIASTVETKTAAGDNLSTVWTEGDALNVFHVFAGYEDYQNDGKFELTGGNTFKGELSGALDEETSYNWYAFYPYTSYMTDPIGTKGYMPVGSKKGASQVQKGNDSMAHIAGENYPLAGVSEDVEYFQEDPIEINMSHLSSLLEVVVTNTTSEDLVVESVSFTGTEPIIGTYYIDFTGESPVFKSSGEGYVDMTANLVVEDGAPIATGASARFYLAIKPFEAKAGSKLTLYVNGAAKDITLEKDVLFEAGHIKTLNYSVAEAATGPEELTVEEFLDKEVNSAVWYQLTGTIQNLVNTTYGNFYLVDDTGSVFVYGLTASQVASNDKSFASLGLREGDVVTLIGTRDRYEDSKIEDQKNQVGGPAYYVSHVAAPFVEVAGNATVDADVTTYSIEVESNTDWTATASAGVTLDKTSGNGNATVVMTFAANTSEDPVNHTVTFATDESTETFTLTQKGVPAAGEPTVVFEETFAGFNGTMGWTGSVANGQTTTTDNSGWTLVKAYGADGAAKLGTKSAQGSAETPELNFKGSATLTFKAGAWAGDQKTLKISMTGGTLSQTSVTMADSNWTEYEITITNATEGAKIKFEGYQASKARFFLDDVKITQ